MGKRPFYKRTHMRAYHALKDEEYKERMQARKDLRRETEGDRTTATMMKGVRGA